MPDLRTPPGWAALQAELAGRRIGLGCMGMSWAYYPSEQNDERSIDVIRLALRSGVAMVDTADIYGHGANEELVGRALRGQREEAVLSTKCGLVAVPGRERPVPCGRPDHIRRSVEASLRRLNTDHIDLYYLHRVDPAVPIEESWGAMTELVTEGKVAYLGLSEVLVTHLDAAQAIHPVTVVQSEFSLWTHGCLDEVLPWCSANGVGFVAFSPLGRGFLTGTLPRTFEPGDLRATMPRFAQDTYSANARIVNVIAEVATKWAATASQVALAWILAQGEHVVALAGTTRTAHLLENLGTPGLVLDCADLTALNNLPEPSGGRYAP